MRIKQSVVFTAIAVVNFFLLATLQSIFAPTNSGDAATIAELADAGQVGGGAYGMMALIYSFVPGALREASIYIIGAGFVIVSTRRTRTNAHAFLIVFLALAPSLLTIATFQKDLLLVPFILATVYIFTKLRTDIAAIFAALCVYGLYGVLFRDYYFLIAFFFVFFWGMHNTPLKWKLILFLGLVLVVMITPLSIFQTLQSPRDIANANRILRGGTAGSRTAFVNLLEIQGPGSFTINYFYGVARLNLAIFFNFGLKELFLELNLVAYAFAIVTSLRSGSRVAKRAASLVLAHATVLNLFEPDLGSYMRHLSSTLPLVAIMLSDYFSRRKWKIVFKPTTFAETADARS